MMALSSIISIPSSCVRKMPSLWVEAQKARRWGENLGPYKHDLMVPFVFLFRTRDGEIFSFISLWSITDHPFLSLF